MSGWETCRICGKRANGWYNVEAHRWREHPSAGEIKQREGDVEAIRTGIDQIKERQQEYESLLQYSEGSYPAVVLRAIEVRLNWLRQDFAAVLRDEDAKLARAEANMAVVREKARQTAELVAAGGGQRDR